MCLQAKHMARFQVHARLQHCTIDLVICSNDVLQALQVRSRWSHSTRWHDLQQKSWLLVVQWYCILRATTRKVIVTITCDKKGAHMHNHLADDDDLVFWSVQWYPHSQSTVNTHTKVGFRNWQLKKVPAMDIASIHMNLDCCWTSNKILHKSTAHTMYCSRTCFHALFDCFQT